MAAGGTGGPWGGGQPKDAAALTVTAPSWQSELARNGQVALAKPVISIGSDPACDVAIFDPGVAPRHAVIRAVQGGYAIEDLGSATGTWVEGRRVAPATPAPLAPGQRVRIGGADLALVAVVTGEAGTIVASGPERTVRAGAQQAQPSATPGAGGPAAPAMPPYAAAAPAPSGPQYATAAAIPATPAPHMQPQPQPQYAAPATPPSFGAPQPAAPVAPVAVMAPAVPVTPPIAGPQQPYGNLGASQARFDFNVWLQAQKPRLYWKFFLIGLGVLILAEMVANSTQNTNMVPLILLVYSALVPVTFVIYCWEQGAEAAQMPP